jgi:uncharacterized cofD-like protein
VVEYKDLKTSLKIVTIGGGTGSPTVLKALVAAGLSHLSAICTSTDSGGKTGIIRSDERDRVIAISDLLRNLLALISDQQNHLDQVTAFTDLASFVDGRGRNLGYSLYYALLEKYSGDFLKVQRHLEQLLHIKFHGTAIPVTLQSANICFSTSNGQEFHGEHELDRQALSTNTITKVWLDHKVPATPQALESIAASTHIIYSPGSLYGSVIANFLPTGVVSALKASTAQKILITNLVSNRNQTHHFSPLDYWRLFQKYTHLKNPFNIFIYPHLTEAQFDAKYPKVAATYATEHSHFLGWTPHELAPLNQLGVKCYPADVFSITPHLYRLRHDSLKLSRVFKSILKKTPS